MPDNIINLLKLSRSSDISKLKLPELIILCSLFKHKTGKWVPLCALSDLYHNNSQASNSFSRSLTKLSQNDWITTRKDSEDGKNKQLRLSVKGRKRIQKILADEQCSFFENDNPPSLSIDNFLPKTSPRHYLTGMSALNIPSNEGTGDWHFIETFEGGSRSTLGPFFIAGDDYSDTYEFLGLDGIKEVSEVLRKAGLSVNDKLFAANHYRAMIDMIYDKLTKGLTLESYKADDWFPRKRDKEKLGQYIKKIYYSIDPVKQQRLEEWMILNHVE
ncbi:MarR family winged helix-turn-helix transcriptional regulator [Neptuniibacter sp. 2_MG-2023]|uniref:MarR family winged helix-turn-helix transcriptional regulator n=1 Tax=Neptuniibacter sp. 2_MG-2023 TaxID=3062671 RepID=UPI0026E1C5F9|nr:MarR family winged helix-turn-helix transcriptional regulator [Neptuniibacter sp. 2_MG-2023]MDO6514394.1 MarR family winged helix-turn-helix transcriptional regulator [Neptuniibacter sp. 2_MG-2023]